ELETARDAALESTRLKSEFLANMSHEIRNPMNGVVGMIELLLETRLDDRQRRLAEAVSVSADALLGIVNDILDLSRVEAGKLDFETRDFNLADVVDGAVVLFYDAASRKALSLSASLDPDVPTQVSGDPGRFRQVLVNLLANAVRFTEHGEIAVRVERQL